MNKGSRVTNKPVFRQIQDLKVADGGLKNRLLLLTVLAKTYSYCSYFLLKVDHN